MANKFQVNQNVRVRFTGRCGKVEGHGADGYTVRFTDGSTGLYTAKELAQGDGGEPGYIYLIHFSESLEPGAYWDDRTEQYVTEPDRSLTAQQMRQHAEHYIGWTSNLEQRLAEHEAGKGARLLQVLRERGISWQVVWVTTGTRDDERYLKNQKHAQRFCPHCHANYLARKREYASATAVAMAMPMPVYEQMEMFV